VTNLLELLGVTFGVPGRTLLAPLDLAVAPGSVTGLIGQNGSGKSTLLKLMARLEQPGAGAIRLGGRPIGSWGARAFAREVALMPQATPPADGMLVRELVALGRYPWVGPLGRMGPADRGAIAAALALAGVERFADRLVDTLSGGERQRAWLALLLAQEAKCLLLDEPTSALDVLHQVEILKLIRRLCHERGLTIVIVLHDVNMAARFCDTIVALHSGRKIFEGPAATVMNRDALRAIYDADFAIYAGPSGSCPICAVE
jgi:ferric hydroxamate transport system ATP-binding protein